MEPLAFLVLLAIFIGAVAYALAGPLLVGGFVFWLGLKIASSANDD